MRIFKKGVIYYSSIANNPWLSGFIRVFHPDFFLVFSVHWKSGSQGEKNINQYTYKIRKEYRRLVIADLKNYLLFGALPFDNWKPFLIPN